ncbi:lipid A biosynthesis acyltransferase [Sulfuricaulis limicola]|uniref:Lipid A biosynthesis acyltransferase n=1 Tax=Sulfuricaulis limicola TaxID=1620215 RepID=A0A1B4XC09_9GAMM|nr:lipid A biosynthesis acyltransferase [Sulfuricaulis limicola]BAV32344.1 lipid A biosynthesis acyltransferase [Sulfuricaulis limicola]
MSPSRSTKTRTDGRDQSPSYLTLKLPKSAYAPRWWPSWLWLLFLRCTALLPLAWSRALGAGLGLLMMVTNEKRASIARVNLEMCFPKLSLREREHLLRRHFIVNGQSYFDLAWLAWTSERRLLRKTHFRGLEQYHELRGRNIILLAPHCVGLNFGGTMASRARATFSMVKLQRDPVVNWLLNRGRMRFGSFLLSRTQGLRPVIRGLKQGLAFYYLPDEDFGQRQSVFVPFFGVPTATLTTLGRLAHMTNALVVPCFTRLLPGGRGYEVILKPPLEDFPNGDRVRDAARMNEAIEEGLRPMPEQYLWTFKLFKTRPGNAPSPYG